MRTIPRPVSAIDHAIVPAATAMVWVGEGHPHEVVAVPGVVLAPGDVLVEVELATVCGSDVHTVQGHRGAPTPLVLGHEYVGRIVAVGGSAETVGGAPLGVGDRVVWSIFAACERCDRCRRGLPQKCRDLRKYGHERIAPRWELTGGFASHVHLLAGTSIVRVGDARSAEVLAPASCGTATAYAALERAARTVEIDGGVVLVLGAGLIGLTATAMATDRGARVIVADPDPARAEQARAFGAAAVIDPRGASAIEDACAALGASEIAAVIEASGSPRAVEQAIAAVGVGGVVCLVGSVFPAGTVGLDPEQIVRRLVTIRGVHNYDGADLVGATAYLQQRGEAYPFAELIGARYRLEDVDQAIAEAARAASVRVAIDPRCR